MKPIVLLLVMALLPMGAFAQMVTVLDKTSLQPLVGVVVTSEAPPAATVTDARGHFDAAAFRGAAQVTFSLIGYQAEAFTFAELEAMRFRVLLSERSYDLDEVVVSASRFEERRRDVAQQVEVIGPTALQAMNAPTSADVLQQSGQVLVQKSQLGGGSPILRGFEASRVLMVVDGVRLNNAIYRAGHLQNSITLDNNMLQKLEVVFGPGSTVYGSDALGGVMHFHTKDPQLATGPGLRTEGTAFLRYGSAANEQTGHLNANLGFRRVGLLTSLTHSRFDDLRQGDNRNPDYGDWGKRLFYVERRDGQDVMIDNDDPNIQRLSGYTQYDFLQKILFLPNNHRTHLLNVQYSTSTDVPRYDRLNVLSAGVPRFAEWYYGPQRRLLTAYTLHATDIAAWAEDVRLTAAYQNIEESRHDRRFGRASRESRIEQVDVFTLNLDIARRFGPQELRYGAEGTFNDVQSRAFTTDVNTGAQGPLDTRYPDGGATMASAAVYVTHTWEAGPHFILNDGLRLSTVRLDATFNDKTFFPFPFDQITQRHTAVTGNLGLIVLPGYEWRVSVLGATGFRAPNVDDLSKVFESIPGSVIVPNPDLKPEYTTNTELAVSKGFWGRGQVEGVLWYTRYRDAFTTVPGTFNGQTQLAYGGESSNVLNIVNAQRARLYGVTARLRADLTRFLSLHGAYNFTYGRIETDSTDYPLDHIPPVFGKAGAQVSLPRFQGEAFVLFNGWKRLEDYNLVGEDNYFTSAVIGQGMPAWQTVNLRVAYQVSPRLQVQTGIENVFDRNYRVFASGISAAGRNLYLTLRGTL
jgi:hemoglobin/transferrin/lactoferrin receptor protein